MSVEEYSKKSNHADHTESSVGEIVGSYVKVDWSKPQSLTSRIESSNIFDLLKLFLLVIFIATAGTSLMVPWAAAFEGLAAAEGYTFTGRTIPELLMLGFFIGLFNLIVLLSAYKVIRELLFLAKEWKCGPLIDDSASWGWSGLRWASATGLIGYLAFNIEISIISTIGGIIVVLAILLASISAGIVFYHRKALVKYFKDALTDTSKSQLQEELEGLGVSSGEIRTSDKGNEKLSATVISPESGAVSPGEDG
ncbi:MAG: hypothetical protein FWE48_06790 [Coriobacteriia bacterium]|nr:hypothetical protein [Coriobacteriia bacterium]